MRLDLEFTRLIAATPEEVFDAFTDPAGQQAFYGQDDPGWIVQSQCDLRIGGVWSVDFGPSPRELYRHRHVFEVIERPHRLVLTTTETRLNIVELTRWRKELRAAKLEFSKADTRSLAFGLHARNLCNLLANSSAAKNFDEWKVTTQPSFSRIAKRMKNYDY